MSGPKDSYNDHKESLLYDYHAYTRQSNPPPYDEIPGGQYPAASESEQRSQNGALMPYHPQYQYQAVGENASYYNEARPQYYHNNPASGEQNGERGLGSTVLGGLAGGYVANQMGAGPMGTAGGAILGATGMHMATNMLQNNQSGLGAFNNGGYGTTTTTTTTTSQGVGAIGGLPLGGLAQARSARRAIRRQRLGLF
ncbi:hypothetical protein DPV78_009329 [Talaromyces pinophilus]|nr:hypothetical protein DPV78_009329 [Talaromyces pinophilus]